MNNPMHAIPAQAPPLPDTSAQPGFYQALLDATQDERRRLMNGTLVTRGLAGELTLEEYRAFLAQAYHHVSHTVTLMMACGSELSRYAPALGHHRYQALANALTDYIEEEKGHEQWILDDLEATGIDREAARSRPPLHETELMVAYAYDSIRRRHPLTMFGMVLVLEGTSTSAASQAGRAIRDSLGLGDDAFHYLFSHGELDVSHMAFFAKLMDTLTSPDDQAQIIHAAKAFYRLYGAVHEAALQDATHWQGQVCEDAP